MIKIFDKEEEKAIIDMAEFYLNESLVPHYEYTIIEDLIETMGYKIEDNGLYVTITKGRKK